MAVSYCAPQCLNCLPGRVSGNLSYAFSIVFLLFCWAVPNCQAVTKDTPEVRELVDKGLKYLESHTDERLGGRCLVALCFVKEGASLEHPRIQEAIKACEAMSANDLLNENHLYSNGLAIIFLSELDPVKYRGLIERFAGALANRQKPHGGWGYESELIGDTSQTQYAILAYWELMQIGLAPRVESVEKGANWLMRTQDPSGAWGYKGMDPGSFKLKNKIILR